MKKKGEEGDFHDMIVNYKKFIKIKICKVDDETFAHVLSHDCVFNESFRIFPFSLFFNM